MERNVYKAFSEAVLLDDWRAVNENYQLEESRCTPYALGGFFIMDRTIRWWGKKHPHDSMTNFVFEEGDKNKGDFMWMMESVIRQDVRCSALRSHASNRKGWHRCKPRISQAGRCVERLESG